MITSEELNLLIYRYLLESGFKHSAFTFANESLLTSALKTATTGERVNYKKQKNKRKRLIIKFRRTMWSVNYFYSKRSFIYSIRKRSR